jgi:hypothetical protein
VFTEVVIKVQLNIIISAEFEIKNLIFFIEPSRPLPGYPSFHLPQVGNRRNSVMTYENPLKGHFEILVPLEKLWKDSCI